MVFCSFVGWVKRSVTQHFGIVGLCDRVTQPTIVSTINHSQIKVYLGQFLVVVILLKVLEVVAGFVRVVVAVLH